MLPGNDIWTMRGQSGKSWLLLQPACRLRIPAAFLFLLILASFPNSSYAQCNSSTPSYTVNLTGSPSGSDTITSTRSGRCCGTNTCVEFNVTLDADAAGLRIDISGGTGTTYYKVNCNPSGGILVGSQVCLTGTGPYSVTVCKPGGNAQTYIITSIPKPHIPYGNLYAKQGCAAILTADGFKEDSITWTAVNTSYNSYLSCTTGCDTSYVNIDNNFPAYADFVVYGPASSSCLSGTFYDTVRVYYVESHAGNDTTICASANYVNLNGTIEGGPSGQWINGTGTFYPNDTTLTARYTPSEAEVNAGYAELVLQTDSLYGCGPDYDTVRITIEPAPSPTVTGNNVVCESDNSVFSTPTVAGYTYLWTAIGGDIISGQGTSEISVDWDSSGTGFIYLKVTNSNGCEAIATLSPIVQYDFNHTNLKKATVGPDATSADADAISTGVGMSLLANCGGSKGLDLTIPGSTFDYGRLAMFFRFQRDESQAEFFERGGLLFDMAGGTLRVTLKVKDNNGVTSTIGPISTGYSVPNDDQFRAYILAYDSIYGKLNLYVNGMAVWGYTTGANTSLDWSGAGNGVLGGLMDGNCSQKALLDFANISLPVSIRNAPAPAITGIDTAVCQNTGAYSYQTAFNSGNTYTWSATGGTINGTSNSNSVQVSWGAPGTGILSVTETLSNGCSTTDIYNVTIISKPDTDPILQE